MIAYQQIDRLPYDYLKRKISEFLTEDMPEGDKTTLGIFSKHSVKAIVQAEDDLILSGGVIIPFFFENFATRLFFSDGDFVKNREIIAEITGEASEILTRERTLLNLIQRMSGIANNTKKYVDLAKPYNIKILDTRKTVPGLRLFDKYAVHTGGGYNHRLDLSSGILIKDNHIQAAGTITNAVKKIKSMNYKLPIELEVENYEQIDEGLKVGVDGFLLDNMSRELTIKCVEIIRNAENGDNILIESSGGINLENIREYLDTGINAISIGALTHSVKGANIHIEILE